MNNTFIVNGRGVAAERGWSWIADAWKLFMRQPGIWLAVTIVALIIFIVLALIPFLGTLASFVLTPVFAGGVVLGCRALEEGRSLELGHLFAGFRTRSAQLVTVGLLYLAAMVVIGLIAFLISGASIFTAMGGGKPVDMESAMASLAGLLIAVLVMLALWVPVLMALWFAPPLVVFHEMGAIDALKASFIGCLKNIVPFLLYGVILFIAAIVASIPLGLGWLILLPVTFASVYTGYRDIFFS